MTITRSPIYGFGTKAISFDSPGVNSGIGAPTLRVGPRQANGTLPITGTTDDAGAEIDLRPTIDDIRKAGDIEITLALPPENTTRAFG